MDFSNMPQFRPVEIKTYHKITYDRVSPSTTAFEASNKTLLITAGGKHHSPASTGIGYSISESFAKAGIARIIILQRRGSVLAAAKEALEKYYPNTKVETYVASQSDLPRITEILHSVGDIDILVPCATSAGGMSGHKSTKDVNADDVAEAFTTNVVGLFHLVREFLSLPSTASGKKSVIHVSSNASQSYIPGISAYATSKGAANQLITNFAYDDPTGNVKFYSFHPGAIRTPLAKENVPEDMVVWEDIRLPGDFAVWLASPEAEFLHGRFVWAAWDVDELIGLKEKLANDPSLLTMTLAK